MSFFISLLGAQALMQLLLAVVVLFAPSLLMGISFPLFVILFFRYKNNIGKSVGIIYSVNTLGGVLGSLLAGFLLIPVIGLLPTTGLAASLYLITSLGVLLIADEKRVVKGVAFAVIIGTVSVLLFTTKFNYYHFLTSTLKPRSSGDNEKIVYFKENADGAILVKENRLAGREMYNDGVIVAATKGQNLFSHIFPAHLISLLAKKPSQVLVIGSGCAVTSGSLLLYDDVTKLYAVEISKGIVEPAKKYFSDANNNAFSHDKFNLIIQDGKNYVKLTDQRFDVIYASPSLPQSSQGSAGLFTREFFADCKNKLTDSGLQCLWIPLHTYQPKEFLTIVKTFQEVYPHVSLWHPPQTEVTVGLAYLIGSKVPILPDYKEIAQKMNKPEIVQDIKRLGDGAFRTPEEFISFLSIGTKGLKKVTAAISKVNTDNRPIVEFYDRAGDLMQSALMSKIKLIELLGKNSESPYLYIQNIPIELNDTLKNQLTVFYEGKQYLMMGHATSTYKTVHSAKGTTPKNLDIYIHQYYAYAYKLMPENLFLKKYFMK
jgi:spermidine synthase